jgi:TIR domain
LPSGGRPSILRDMRYAGGASSRGFDFFIAHSGSDKSVAEALYELLSRRSTVFLDSRSLRPGDDWHTALGDAQSRSRVTVVLVSAYTGQAFYEGEEVVTAIRLARRGGHRVVPVLLDQNVEVPYGLHRFHSLTVQPGFSLSDVASDLLDLLGSSSVPGQLMGERSGPIREGETIVRTGRRYLGKGDRVRISRWAGTFKPEETGLPFAIVADSGRTGTVVGISGRTVQVRWDPQDWSRAKLGVGKGAEIRLQGFVTTINATGWDRRPRCSSRRRGW